MSCGANAPAAAVYYHTQNVAVLRLVLLFQLPVRSCLYCTHGIGRIAAPMCPMGNEFLHKTSRSVSETAAPAVHHAVPRAGRRRGPTRGQNSGLHHRLRTPIQSHPKAHPKLAVSHPKLCWMGLDEREKPIGRHRKSDEGSSTAHPKLCWMGIGVAVTM